VVKKGHPNPNFGHLRSKLLDFYPKKGIYSVLEYSKIDVLHHTVATPLEKALPFQRKKTPEESPKG
jgi:hypothetical protein